MARKTHSKDVVLQKEPSGMEIGRPRKGDPSNRVTVEEFYRERMGIAAKE